VRARCVAFAVLVTAFGPSEATAHRLDEYLQAARVAVRPDGIRLELDLTPGANIAESVIARIDADGDRRFSGEEGASYARVVLGDVGVWLDGVALAVRLQRVEVSTPQELLDGVGLIRIVATMPTVPIVARHELILRNAHETDRGVFLMNALVPASKNVIITAQSRDRRQQQFRMTYEVRSSVSQLAWLLAAALSVVALGVCRLARR
jgi:hypothetical protein